MVALLERKLVVDGLARLAVTDVVSLWRNASGLPSESFRDVMVYGMPQTVAPYVHAAGEFAVDWYDQAAPKLPYRATNLATVNTSAIEGSTRWALGASGEMALDRLGGVVMRHVLGGARETTVGNTKRETGSVWARYASGNACKFCQMLATRSDVYVSEALATKASGRRGNQAAGSRYHDNCKCMAVEVRPGGKYEPPPWVADWDKRYKDATKAAKSGAVKDILAAWPE